MRHWRINKSRLIAVTLTICLVFPTGAIGAGLSCPTWGDGSLSLDAPVGCVNESAGQQASQRAKEAQNRGIAYQARAADAKDVAGKIDGDKEGALNRFNNSKIPVPERNDFAQGPYHLANPYREKYTQLSHYSLATTGASLAGLPRTNMQLMSFDTAPLKQLQQAQEEEAKKMFQWAEQARLAAEKFQNVAQEANRRDLAMHSIEKEEKALEKNFKHGAPRMRSGPVNSSAALRDNPMGTQRIGRPSEGQASDITKRSEGELSNSRSAGSINKIFCPPGTDCSKEGKGLAEKTKEKKSTPADGTQLPQADLTILAKTGKKKLADGEMGNEQDGKPMAFSMLDGLFQLNREGKGGTAASALAAANLDSLSERSNPMEVLNAILKTDGAGLDPKIASITPLAEGELLQEKFGVKEENLFFRVHSCLERYQQKTSQQTLANQSAIDP